MLGFGFSLPLCAMRRRGGGGTFAFNDNEMLMGMGLTGLSSYSGYYPFSNILWNSNEWERQSGSGSYTQEKGTLTATVGTDVFYRKIAEGTGTNGAIPSGVYTVLNPDGCEIGVGWGGTPNLTGYTTATSFTFTKSSDPDAIMALYAKGSVTNTLGPVRIIMPGQLSAFNSGDYWNPAFLTFIGGLNLKSLRYMDWMQTYASIVVNDADRTKLTDIALTGKYMPLGGAVVPYEAFIDLCNRINVDPWLNLPVRVSNNFIDAFATYVNANLESNRHVYLEFGNETWNFAAPYNDGRVWVELYTHTRVMADSNIGISGWTKTAHGLTTGDILNAFFTPENSTYETGALYPNGYGAGLYVEVVDANNFKTYVDIARTQLSPPTVKTPKLLYARRAEAGKLVSVDINHGLASKLVWERFNTIFPRERTTRVMGTQLVGPSLTTDRLSGTGVTAATDAVAVAGYYQGDWWVACLDKASGQVIPKVWSRYAGGSIRVAVYASGSTPTLAQVMSATGTGYIGHRDLTGWGDDAQTYTTGAAITGLTNGTNYECRAVLTGQYGFQWMAQGTFAASATASTVAIYDSDESMAMRARHAIKEVIVPFINDQKAVIGSLPIVGYETNSDYFGGNTQLAEVKAWRTAWTQTVIAGEVMGSFYQALAATNMKLINHFADVNSLSPGVFNLVESFTDTSDPRYIKFAGYNGLVPKPTLLALSDVLVDEIATAPAYPFTTYTFPNGALTYSIFNGDTNSNFAIVGNELRLVNGTNISYATPSSKTITIEASNGSTTDYFTVSVPLGSAWYAADARFAWDSTIDSTTDEINPVIGNAIPLNGTAPTVSDNLWDMGLAARYISSTASTASIPGTAPFLIAAVIDKDDSSNEYQPIFRVGQASGVYYQRNGSLLQVGRTEGGFSDLSFANPTPTGKQVYWAYYDADPTTPKMHAGVNQTENGTGSATDMSAITMNTGVYIGGFNGTDSNMRHGSVQIVSRAGLTLAQAKAIVQKMQTLHGI